MCFFFFFTAFFFFFSPSCLSFEHIFVIELDGKPGH